MIRKVILNWDSLIPKEDFSSWFQDQAKYHQRFDGFSLTGLHFHYILVRSTIVCSYCLFYIDRYRFSTSTPPNINVRTSRCTKRFIPNSYHLIPPVSQPSLVILKPDQKYARVRVFRLSNISLLLYRQKWQISLIFLRIYWFNCLTTRGKRNFAYPYQLLTTVSTESKQINQQIITFSD